MAVDGSDTSEMQFGLEWEYQLVAMMVLRGEAKDPKARVFRDASEVRKELTPNEAAWFVERHAALQQTEMHDWENAKALPDWAVGIAGMLGLDQQAAPDDIAAAVRSLMEQSNG